MQTIQSAPAPSVKAHPFELAGLDHGPYRFIGAVSIPAPSLGEQNPTAYMNALAALPRDLVNGCGTCGHCGRGIMNVCIVLAATGRKFGVGCDCIRKSGDASIGNAALVGVSRLERLKRQAKAELKRAARHAAWLAAVDPSTGETREERNARERQEREAAQALKAAAVVARFGFLLPALDGSGGDFSRSLSDQIRGGQAPSGRALDICVEIYARQFGRRGSKAFDAACAVADEKLNLPAS